MTLQRRRFGKVAEFYGLTTQTDARGIHIRTTDMSAPVARLKCWALPDADRFQDMSLHGQQEIVMFELGAPDHPMFHDRTVSAGARVFWNEYWWDVVQPPVERRGANHHVRHWRLSLRRRPLGDDPFSG